MNTIRIVGDQGEILHMTNDALLVSDRDGDIASIYLTDEMKEAMWRELRNWKSSRAVSHAQGYRRTPLTFQLSHRLPTDL